VNPPVEHRFGHLGELVAKLRENLELCIPGKETPEPSVDAIHDVRTGTRRIEAQLDALLRDEPEESVAGAIAAWQRLLKKIRRAAAPARDLDVHRKILEKLVKRDAPEGEGEAQDDPRAVAVHQQADDLDAWLRHVRAERAVKLQKQAAKWSSALEEDWKKFQAAAALAPKVRTSRENKAQRSARFALDAFARLSFEMHQLHTENLHDFRKEAKKARYMAESGGEDEYAGAVGKALKKLQDEIGDWHDWLMLAEEAASVLGEQGCELIAMIEGERDSRYASAIATTEKLRGRLMGEWQVVSAKRRSAMDRSAEKRSAGRALDSL
jgi:CHAD domain-containing protein